MFGLFKNKCKHKNREFTEITLQDGPDFKGYKITREVIL